MHAILIGLLTASALMSPLDDSPAVEIRYSGTLTQVDRNGTGAPVKRFSIYCLAINGQRGSRELAFLVDENGGGGWPWPERFGIISLDSSNQPTNQAQVSLLHKHDDNLNPIPVRQPFFEYADKLKPKAAWNAGKFAYQVLGNRRIKDRDCWQIEVTTNFGKAQTLFVDKQSLLLVSANQTVFMGRGDRFSLKLDLQSARPIDDRQFARLHKPMQMLAKLQNDLNRPLNQRKNPELTDQQLETASAVIEHLLKNTERTPFSRYASVISRDVKLQLQRFDDVATLAKRYVGARAPNLRLKMLNGKTIDAQQNAGKIVVLHFWEYQGDPLVEPYGQVGFLDFLHSQNRRRKLNVNIYGVAVDSRLADNKQQSTALRSIRELNKFFNLSYTVTVDDGTLLRQFGDPRRVGAKLPLWVVIAPDGKIAHYSTGFYQIKADEGLKQLEAEIIKIVRRRRSE